MLPFLGHMFIAHHQPECPAARFPGSACLSCCYGLSLEQLASFEALLKAADIAGGMRKRFVITTATELPSTKR